MNLQIDHILTREELSGLSELLAYGEFEPGASTAGWGAQAVKHNLQLSPQGSVSQQAKVIVAQALGRSLEFTIATRPKWIGPPLFARYEAGMEYGPHVDDPMMAGPPSFRTDVAFTIFLAEPAEYDGGELLIEDTYGTQSYKLAAGSLVLYPSSSVHRVTPVTGGIRLVALSWLQSLIREPARRQILYDLDRVRRALVDEHGQTPELVRLSQSLANLIRMWAEP